MRLQTITAADLASLGHLLPRSGVDLVRCIGLQAALEILNGLPGAVMTMPKTPANNPHAARRWAQLVQVTGSAQAVRELAAQYGGGPLEVPTCHQLRLEKRNRWLRERFDALTAGNSATKPGPAMSRNAAVYELGLELAQAGECMTHQGIENVLDNPGPAAAAARAGDARSAQAVLFE